ncbi:MAG: CbbX protein, partial [Cyanobacteriota bacterium]|nr:CbbX protein [Cyanobacteriota bacterium]
MSSSEGMGTEEPRIDLQRAYDTAGIQQLLNQLDEELIGLKPVKARIREIAALLVVNR